VAFYATGEEEIVKKEDVTLTVRRP
jgi:hypothetical protein